jgi:lysozyme
MLSLRSLITMASALLLGACSASGSSGESSCSSGNALRVCSTGTTIKGVDVSTYQGTVNWASVKATGYVFGFARISDGLNHNDATFAPNWHAMKTAGVIRGAYQFFRPSQDPVQQADLVIAALAAAGPIASGDLPAVLDLEVTDGMSNAVVVSRAKQWLAHIESATGRKPLVYTAAFMSATIGTSFGGYPLWVANYGTTCPSMPSGWTDWRFWQDSSTGSVSGISGSVDTNEFQGTLAQLKTFTEGTAGPSHDAGSPPSPDAGSSDPNTHVQGSAGSVMGDGFRGSVELGPVTCGAGN